MEAVLTDGEKLVGRVEQGGATSVWLDVDGHTREIALDRVRRATVQVEFTRLEDAELADAEGDGADSEEG